MSLMAQVLQRAPPGVLLVVLAAVPVPENSDRLDEQGADVRGVSRVAEVDELGLYEGSEAGGRLGHAEPGCARGSARGSPSVRMPQAGCSPDAPAANRCTICG